MERPLVSVVVPVYNHAKEARELILNLEKQTYRPFEVIMVDDGSTDGLKEMVESMMEGIEAPNPFVYVRQDNQGAPVARNEGFKRSEGSYVLFLDADIRLDVRAIELMVQALNTHPEASFAYSPFRFGGKLFKGHEFSLDILKKHNYIHTASLIRREDFSGFDPSLKRFQDWDLWLTLAKKGKRGVRIDQVLFSVGIDFWRHVRMSTWVPKFMHQIPWNGVGWMPKVVRSYREAEAVIKKKHGL